MNRGERGIWLEIMKKLLNFDQNQSIAFFPKIPEINLGRFSFRFSFGVIAIHEK